MLSGLFYMAKMVAITILVCMVLQTKIGSKTIEQELYTWIQNSVAVDYLQTAIDGGVSVTHTGYNQLHKIVNSALSKMSRHDKKSGRGFEIDLKRFKEKLDNEEAETEVFLPKVRNRTQQIK